MGGIELDKSVYTYHQTNERLASKETLVTYSPFTLLHAIRTKKLIPYVWFNGYIASYVDKEYSAYEDVLIDKSAKYTGFVAANSSVLQQDFEQLCLGHKSSIRIDMTDRVIMTSSFALAECGFGNKLYLFNYDFRERHSDFPVSIGRLENLGYTPGMTVTRDNLVFLVDEVEQYISSDISKLYDLDTCIELEDENEKLKIEIEELKYQVEQLLEQNEQLQEQNKYLSGQVSKIHPALDPDDSRFAPEVYIALKMCDFIHDKQQQQISENGKADSHTSLAEEFYEINGLNIGERNNLMKRLTSVSNFSKKDSSFINLAKSIK